MRWAFRRSTSFGGCINRRPAPGLGKFRAAFRKVEAAAADIGIGADVFEAWADGLRFVCDDRDDEVPW